MDKSDAERADNLTKFSSEVAGEAQGNFSRPISEAANSVLRSQKFILEQFTGRPWDQGALTQEGIERGWLSDGSGVSVEHIGKLLELHGVPINRHENANLYDLAAELSQGRKVLVCIDSQEIQAKYPTLHAIADLLGFSGADRVIIVSGIDTSNPEDVQVMISNPETGETIASYSMLNFLSAWRDSDFTLVSTQEPAPSWLPEMANFDYELGHIPNIGTLAYEDFIQFKDNRELSADNLEELFKAHYWTQNILEWRLDVANERETNPLSNPYVEDSGGAGSSYPSSFDPSLVEALESTNKRLSEAQNVLDQVKQNNIEGEQSSSYTSANSGTAAIMRMTSGVVQRAKNIAEGKYSMEELEEMNKQTQAQIAFLGGQVAAAGISNSVAKSEQTIRDRNTAHESRRLATGYRSDAAAEGKKAAEEMRHGGDSSDELNRAKSDLANAEYHDRWADNYDPDK
jgi:hypothetical protein